MTPIQEELLHHSYEGLLILEFEGTEDVKIEYLNEKAASILNLQLTDRGTIVNRNQPSSVSLPDELWAGAITCLLKGDEMIEGTIQTSTYSACFRMRRSQQSGRLLVYIQGEQSPIPCYTTNTMSYQDQQWAALLQDACGPCARLLRWDQDADDTVCIKKTTTSRDVSFGDGKSVSTQTNCLVDSGNSSETNPCSKMEEVKVISQEDLIWTELYFSCHVLYVGKDLNGSHYLVISLDDVLIRSPIRAERTKSKSTTENDYVYMDEHPKQLKKRKSQTDLAHFSQSAKRPQSAKEAREALRNIRGVYDYCKGKMTEPLDLDVLGVLNLSCGQLDDLFSTDEKEVSSSLWKKSPYLGQYKTVEYIKKGSASTVARACDKKGHNVVVKSIKKNDESAMYLSTYCREVEILANLSHPNIVKMLEAIETPTHYHLITEYVKGVTLDRYIEERGGKLYQGEARALFNQLAEGLAHCHQRGISHRDVKTTNIMVGSGGRVCLIDFGLSNYSSFCRTFCGTLLNNSPEMLSGQEYDGPTSDSWSAGVVLFQLLTGRVPFCNAGQILASKLEFTEDEVTEMTQDILSRLMSPDRRHRMTMDEYLRSGWATGDETTVQQGETRPCSSDMARGKSLEIYKEYGPFYYADSLIKALFAFGDNKCARKDTARHLEYLVGLIIDFVKLHGIKPSEKVPPPITPTPTPTIKIDTSLNQTNNSTQPSYAITITSTSQTSVPKLPILPTAIISQPPTMKPIRVIHSTKRKAIYDPTPDLHPLKRVKRLRLDKKKCITKTAPPLPGTPLIPSYLSSSIIGKMQNANDEAQRDKIKVKGGRSTIPKINIETVRASLEGILDEERVRQVLGFLEIKQQIQYSVWQTNRKAEDMGSDVEDDDEDDSDLNYDDISSEMTDQVKISKYSLERRTKREAITRDYDRDEYVEYSEATRYSFTRPNKYPTFKKWVARLIAECDCPRQLQRAIFDRESYEVLAQSLYDYAEKLVWPLREDALFEMLQQQEPGKSREELLTWDTISINLDAVPPLDPAFLPPLLPTDVLSPTKNKKGD
ncbi:sperm motility kinase 2B [Planoprotostelium fungivorum]|uniref:Sperm motility kinase 2B n=1 Tax=Planoprotostelium fungivorum TaxID=1890364 RepID=A0A2P6NSJ8_9EUKA|nr:sperm motility kinase 2B [Planoprotostelium fungivorum]